MGYLPISESTHPVELQKATVKYVVGSVDELRCDEKPISVHAHGASVDTPDLLGE